jgi:hypothetical protein
MMSFHLPVIPCSSIHAQRYTDRDIYKFASSRFLIGRALFRAADVIVPLVVIVVDTRNTSSAPDFG